MSCRQGGGEEPHRSHTPCAEHRAPVTLCRDAAHGRVRDPTLSRPPTVREAPPRSNLLADFETANDVEVTLRIDLFEVIQQPPTTADQHQQASPAGEIPLVTLQMLGQSVDPRRQNGNLDLRGASIVGTPLEFPDQSRLPLFVIVICYRDRSTSVGSGCFYRKPNPPTAFATTLPTKCVSTTTKLLSVANRPAECNWGNRGPTKKRKRPAFFAPTGRSFLCVG